VPTATAAAPSTEAFVPPPPPAYVPASVPASTATTSTATATATAEDPTARTEDSLTTPGEQPDLHGSDFRGPGFQGAGPAFVSDPTLAGVGGRHLSDRGTGSSAPATPVATIPVDQVSPPTSGSKWNPLKRHSS
jgi:hypothetical protein